MWLIYISQSSHQPVWATMALKNNPILRAFTIDFNQHIRFGFVVKELRFLLRVLPIKGSRLIILDAGAGMGLLSEYFYMKFKGDIISTDISDRYKYRGFVIADSRALPFRDNSFDFVVSTDVLEHIPNHDREKFLRELLRCSKYGAVITYSKIHKYNPASGGVRMFERLCRNKFPDWYLEHNSNELVDDNRLAEALKKSGAEVIEFKPLMGILGLYLTGLQCVTSALRPRHLYSVFNIFSYIIARFIDPPPHYNFGLVALKSHGRTNQGAESEAYRSR